MLNSLPFLGPLFNIYLILRNQVTKPLRKEEVVKMKLYFRSTKLKFVFWTSYKSRFIGDFG